MTLTDVHAKIRSARGLTFGNAVAVIAGRDVRSSSLSGSQVRDGTLTAGDFGPGQLPAGPKGERGPPQGWSSRGIPWWMEHHYGHRAVV